LSKRYTQRKNRRARARHERNERRRAKREFLGRCSNCREKNILVRRIAGGQVCFTCAKKLPGHLLRKVFPIAHDPGLAKFLREHEVVSSTAVDRPGEPETPKKRTWWERLTAFLRQVIRQVSHG
jgi:hypothetical protein